MKNIEQRYREFLPESRRVIVKIGTRVIAQPSGRPDLARLRKIVRQLAALQNRGYQVLVVTSGAIGAGMEILGLKERPTAVPDLQMCAAVGQARLMAHYEEFFAKEKRLVGQVLLTHADLQHRIRTANVRRTLEHLLRAGVIPVINENDVVADEEIKADLSLGDNDFLASLIVKLVRADLLVILSTVDGVLAPTGPKGAMRRIPCIEQLNQEVFKLIMPPAAGGISKGGMDSKLTAAQSAAKSGCTVVIANGRQDNVLTDCLDGKDVGTLLLSTVL